MAENPSCLLRHLPPHRQLAAAQKAISVNPVNAPVMAWAIEVLTKAVEAASSGDPAPPLPRHEMLAVMTSKYWGAGGVDLSVSFLDTNSAELKAKILAHMNAWGAWANVRFRPTAGRGQVRIARTPGDGYWSYLGTDVLSVPAGEPTMNLDSFGLATPDSEYMRVVRHETGHTLGCPHEHLRRGIIARLDRDRTIAFFQAQYGWSPQTTVEQVLTPVEESALLGTPEADVLSIMTYQLPGAITVDGQPIPGGLDIDPSDGLFIAKIYPKAVTPTPTPTPTPSPHGGGELATVQGLDGGGKVLWKAPVPKVQS